MHKHVMPKDAGATIPDPVRNRALPPEGAIVEWSAYWAGLEARGDIEAVEADDPSVEPEAAELPAEPDASA